MRSSDKFKFLDDIHHDFVGKRIPLTNFMKHSYERLKDLTDYGKNSLNTEDERIDFIADFVRHYCTPRKYKPYFPDSLVNDLNTRVADRNLEFPLTRFLKFYHDKHVRAFDNTNEDGFSNYLVHFVTSELRSRNIPDALLSMECVKYLNANSKNFTDENQLITRFIEVFWHRASHGADWNLISFMDRISYSAFILSNVIGNLNLPYLITASMVDFWAKPISPNSKLSRFAYVVAASSMNKKEFGDGKLVFENPVLLKWMVKEENRILEWLENDFIAKRSCLRVLVPSLITNENLANSEPKYSYKINDGKDLTQNESDQFDLLLVGLFGSVSGLGNSTTRTVGALTKAGVNVRTKQFIFDNPNVKKHIDKNGLNYVGGKWNVNLFHVNAEYLPEALVEQHDIWHRANFNICFPYWETEMHSTVHDCSLSLADEFWVATEFAKKIFSPSSAPITNVGAVVELPEIKHEYQRSYFGIPDDCYAFMFSFDGHSVVARKNPIGAIRAFKAAFPKSNRDVRLVVKSQNLRASPWAKVKNLIGELYEEISSDDRIILIDSSMTTDEFYSLKKVVDCYVSLHRSEGFGYGPAEALYLGKPVIVTDYSGTMDFCNSETSFLVPYKLVYLDKSDYIYWTPGMSWAEPDIEAAAEQMKIVFENTSEAHRKASNGQALVKNMYSYKTVGEKCFTRLKQLGFI